MANTFQIILVVCFIVQAFCFLVTSAADCIISPNPSKVAYTITVSQAGDANFTTITDALNFVPPGNNQWIKIFVNQGTYNEKIQIKFKECIFLEGSDRATTIITNDAHSTALDSITFDVYIDNFLAKDITFKNSYNRALEESDPNPPPVPAVALRSIGDKHAFYSCGFVGYQDTLWDEMGRHYFKSCYIEGAIDFIWGNGQSVYEGCSINVTGGGFIAAQSRQSAQDPSGYVIRSSTITGLGHMHTELGRAYGPFSRVIYINSKLGGVVNPEGWFIWNQHGHENDITFAEVGCRGPGSNTDARVPWEKKLGSDELEQYTTQNFIDNDGWIANQPLIDS